MDKMPNNAPIDPNAFIMPKEFNIFMSYGNRAVKKIDPETFKITQNTYATLLELKKQLWFTPEENKIVFSHHYLPNQGRASFSIKLGDESVQKPGPRLRITVSSDGISRVSSSAHLFDRVLIDDLPTIMHKRFKNYDLTPVNGWGFMHYLDYVTNWKFSWSEKTIHTLDELISQKVSMNNIWLQLEYDVPPAQMLDNAFVPTSWLKKAYGEKVV
jgi:hypothetical protein